MLSSLAWLRSAEILDNSWIVMISFGLFLYCLSGCLGDFILELQQQHLTRNITKRFVNIPQLLVCWPALLYCAFNLGIFILIILRYRTIMTVVRSGHGFLL